MIELKNKYCIGTHIMFYEIEMLESQTNALIQTIETVKNPENITIEMFLNCSEYFEQLDTEYTWGFIRDKFYKEVNKLRKLGVNVVDKIYENNIKPYTIGSYRRDLNYNYCEYNDFIIWGETDCLLPKETFGAIELISGYASSNNINRYCLTFGVRRMWDSSWDSIVHDKFLNNTYHEMHEPEKWKNDPSSIWYTMDQDQMNEINSQVDDLNIQLLAHPRFDGSGLVISSDLIQSGVNIPHATWACGEDTAFQNMAKIIMGDSYRQFVVKNILKVHNRNHPLKREYVKGESHLNSSKEKRNANSLWQTVKKMSESNMNMLGSNQNSFYTLKNLDNEKQKVSSNIS
jgi:hypothetical protein